MNKYKPQHISIKKILIDYPKNKDTIVSIVGWVRTVRHNSKDGLSFCSVNDGSTDKCIQIVINTEKIKDISIFKDYYDKATTGCALRVRGLIIESPAAEQLIELLPEEIIVEGDVKDPSTYPIAKKKLNLDTLRTMCHLRPRTHTFGCVFRLRNALSALTTKFFQNNDFLHIDPNIITTNECEGAAGVFTVTELPLDDLTKFKTKGVDFTNDHFKKQTFLTVSSQLQLEAFACSLGNVYTTNKSFRSEHSNTYKHLSEFTHLEIEMPFVSMDDLMNIGEDYIKFILLEILNGDTINDIYGLKQRQCSDLDERLEKILYQDFIRLTHNECVKQMLESGDKFKELPGYDKDLSSEHENWITNKHGTTYVTYWPFSLKSFYAKRLDDGTTETFDLLIPFIGETIGGSQREDNYDTLISSMKEKNVSETNLEFYTDLRKYGSCKHGGFGLGMDRLLMLLTGMSSIKDVVPIPNWFTHCKY
jgi:asparaginyl-tRNA synthetase